MASALLSAVLVVNICGCRQNTVQPRTGLPKLPTPEAELKDFRDRQDVAGMRRHAWAVFSKITRPSEPGSQQSPPIWDTWEDYADVFEGSGSSIIDHSKQRDIRLPLEVLASIQAGAQANFLNQETAVKTAVAFIKERKVGSEILYNPSAAHHIQSNKLNDYDSLQNRWKLLTSISTPIGESSIPEFPASAIVVKAHWLAVGPTSPESLTVWEPGNEVIAHCEYGCKRELVLKLAAPNQPCNLPLRGQKAVLSSCFYNVPDIITGMGYRLILVGLHVMTKEMQDWTWSTFWWQADPEQGKYARDRPDRTVLEGVWRNYVMDTTLSLITPEEEVSRTTPEMPNQRCRVALSSTAKICFNPFIELEMKPNGAVSNCMTCHRQATYPTMEPDPRGSPQRGYLSLDDPCFGPPKGGNRVMKVDYLWSLSRISPNSDLGRFLDAVQIQLKLPAK